MHTLIRLFTHAQSDTWHNFSIALSLLYSLSPTPLFLFFVGCAGSLLIVFTALLSSIASYEVWIYFVAELFSSQVFGISIYNRFIRSLLALLFTPNRRV